MVQYERATSFRNGFSNVTINGKEGFINRVGEIVVEPKFDIEEEKLLVA